MGICEFFQGESNQKRQKRGILYAFCFLVLLESILWSVMLFMKCHVIYEIDMNLILPIYCWYLVGPQNFSALRKKGEETKHCIQGV